MLMRLKVPLVRMLPPVFLVSLALTVAACSPARDFVLEVAAPEGDRPIAIVEFEFPRGVPGDAWQALQADATAVPVQVGADGTAKVVLTNVAAGESRTLTLQRGGPGRGVFVSEQAGLVSVSLPHGPVVAYHAEKQPLPRDDIDAVYHRSGYLHPVYTPVGYMVTDDYPPNHVHHHGIWSAWTRTTFMGRNPDFWNMHRSTGTVEHVALDGVWEGPVHGGLRARHVQLDLSGEVSQAALNESWVVRVYNTPGVHIIDLTVEQTLATDSTLYLQEHLYGGVGLRGARAWNGAENAEILTSEGRTRADGHATRARWCHIGGLVDNAKVGLAVLGHPDNHEAPEPMRIHPDEPFFNYAPSQAGAFAITPGVAFLLRYRYVVYDGDPDPTLLDALWEDYAAPLTGVVRR